jgi:methylmalonyl-CoA/ethylmalonyl-CoA epimerase
MRFPIHHIGIAVKNLPAAITEYKARWGAIVTLEEELPAQSVRLAFLQAPNTLIELLAPLSPQSTLARFIEKRGEGLHHICYEVGDIVSELARLTREGVTLIDSTPRPGAHQSLIGFVHPKSCGGVLTELCQPKK